MADPDDEVTQEEVEEQRVSVVVTVPVVAQETVAVFEDARSIVVGDTDVVTVGAVVTDETVM